jgi:hypothetical protein
MAPETLQRLYRQNRETVDIFFTATMFCALVAGSLWLPF